MTNKEIGATLVKLCREGKNLESVRTLYAESIESIEPAAAPGMERATRGKAAVIAKNQWWLDNHDIHRTDVDGPYPHGVDKFAVRFRYDVSQKQSGQRFQMEEIGVFTIADGKVDREEFFYDMG